MTPYPPVVTVFLDVVGTPTEVDISSYCANVSINRGRTTQFGEIPAGTCTVSAFNYTRDFDPSHTASPFYGQIQPGQRLRVKVLNYYIFDGNIDDYDYTYDVNGVSTTTITAVDLLATLAKKTFGMDDVTPAFGETTGLRIENLLNLPSVDMLPDSQIDVGVSTLQADVIEAGTNALTYIQLLARTDVGRFYCSNHGLLTFRDRSNYFTSGGPVVFSDVPGTDVVPFSQVDVKFGSDVLYTQVIISRVDGSTETFTDDDAAAIYGIQSTGSEYTGLLLEDDTQSYDIGLELIAAFAEPAQQFSRFVVNMERLDYANTDHMAFLDIGQVVRGIFTPDGIGDPIDQYSMVEGIRHTLSPGEHEMEVFVSKCPVQVF